MDPKSVLLSKTFWMNAIALVSTLLASDQLQAALGPDALKWVIVVQSGLNIALRFLTVGAVTASLPAAFSGLFKK